jgi:peptidyl-prolyl cis-trans isomerase C
VMSTRIVTLTLALALAGGCRGPKADEPGRAGSTGGTGTSATPSKLPPGLPGQSEKDLAEPVATIDGAPITVAEMQDRINKQSPYVRARYTSLEQKKEFLDTLVRFEVLAREAKGRGYDQDAEVVRTMKQVMIQKLLKDEFESKVKPEDIPEDELKKYYEAHSGDYNKPEEMRVSAIIVKDKAKADKAASEAKAAPKDDNKAFRDLVEKYSEDTDSKQRGGDLRFFAADNTALPPAVVKTAFTLKNQGDVAGPIATDKGFFVLKQTGQRKAINKTFEEVKRQIQNRLFRDKRTEAMETFVADLKKSAKIEVKPDALAKVMIDQSQPAMPPGADGEQAMPPPGAPPGSPHSPPASPPSPTPTAAPVQPAPGQ